MATETAQETVKPTQAEAEKNRTRKAGRKKPTAKKPRAASAKAAKTILPRTAATKPAPKHLVRRKQSSPAKRASIIAAADREGLTALQVQKRFGVKPVTYYSWRKAAKKFDGHAKPAAGKALAGLNLSDQVRQALRAQIAEMLPEIIRSEVAAILGGTMRARRSGR